MHFSTILIIIYSQVIIGINSVPVNSRARHSASQRAGLFVNSSNTYSRRRDIRDGFLMTRYESDRNDSQTYFRPRTHLLLPDLDSTGRPRCLTVPNDTFCESVTNYPLYSTFNQEIEYSPEKFSELFGIKVIEGRFNPRALINEDSSGERVCGRISKVIYPKLAKNWENQWIFVVNEVEYTQPVVAEICEYEEKPCAYLDRNLPPGMYSRCKQKYSYKRLLALHPSEKRTYSDTFKFPSYCACYVKSNENLGRFPKVKSRRKN